MQPRIDRLAAELETIAAEVQRDRFVDLLWRSGLTAEQHRAVGESSAFGTLAAALRRAEAYHHDLERLVPRIVVQHGLDDAEDVAAVLKCRLDKAAARPPHGMRRLQPRLIAGLIPESLGPMNDEDRKAIDERKTLIEARARALVEQAVAAQVAWARRFPKPQANEDNRGFGLEALATVAAYRDRYAITSNLPAGGRVANEAQEVARQRVLQATRLLSAMAPPKGGRSSLAAEPRAISAP